MTFNLYVALVTVSVIYLINITYAETENCEFPNVGTVLFKKSVLRHLNCWNREDIALLYTRRVFQDLLPRQIPRNVPHLQEYFSLCLLTLKDFTTSDYTYAMMIIALSDVFGGFFNAYGLSLMNEAYYEGFVDYTNAKRLHNVQSDILHVLETNGEQWAERMEIKKPINKVLPLSMTKRTDGGACSKIVTTDDFSQDDQKIQIEMELHKVESIKGPFIPLPLLDNNKQPSTIAVPLKEHSMYNLFHQCSYDVLLTYYTSASDCIAELSEEGNHETNQNEFEHNFYAWLKNNVLPHLTDEVWYVGFSNVLRIEATIKEKEGFLGISQIMQDNLLTEGVFETHQEKTQPKNALVYFILLVLILIVITIVLGILFSTFLRNFICCCTTIKYNTASSTSDSSNSFSDITVVSKDSNKINEKHLLQDRFSRQNSKSDSQLVYPLYAIEEKCYRMPSLQMIDEPKQHAQKDQQYLRMSVSSRKKKKVKRDKDDKHNKGNGYNN